MHQETFRVPMVVETLEISKEVMEGSIVNLHLASEF